MALPPIDWHQPWLAPWRDSGQRVAQSVAAGLALPDALNAEQAVQRLAGGASAAQQALSAHPQASATPPSSCSGIEFVPQSALPPGQGYEHYMAQTGQCPTRENLHDFFNGLCWLRFPQIKRKINQLHAAELELAGMGMGMGNAAAAATATAGVGTAAIAKASAKASASPPPRGPVRDALTVFDENAAFLLAPPPLWQALEARDWPRLFIELRPLWADAQLVLFGHALLEKLVSPRKPITAHVYRAQPALQSLEALDAWVAADLSAERLAAKPFVPLPVLGIPGWWPENENVSFYDDAQVFRPRR